MNQRKLVFGIGNPGREYHNTRHNLGFRLVDKLAQLAGINDWTSRCQGLIAEARLCNEDVLLVKPLTYVNCCGACLASICQRYSVEPQSLLVAVDDVSLPLGQIRIRGQGSSGSHNGLKSIVNSLDSQLFPRLRLGIGDNGNQKLADYVLANFTWEEEKMVDTMIQTGVDAVITWLKQGTQASMNRYNKKQTIPNL